MGKKKIIALMFCIIVSVMCLCSCGTKKGVADNETTTDNDTTTNTEEISSTESQTESTEEQIESTEEETESSLNEDETTPIIKVAIKDNDGNRTEVLKDNIDGLSWDEENLTLTLKNFKPAQGYGIYIYDENNDIEYGKPEGDKSATVNVVVEGVNTFEGNDARWLHGIKTGFLVDTVFTGNGELNFEGGIDYTTGFIFDAKGDVTFDGPKVHVTGAFDTDVFKCNKIVIKDSYLYFDCFPSYYKGGNTIGCGYMTAYYYELDGGTIVVKYEDGDTSYEMGTECASIVVFEEIKGKDGKIIFTGDEKQVNAYGRVRNSYLKEVSDTPGIEVIKDSKYDVSKYELKK